MNAEKITQKSTEALNAAQATANEYGNAEIKPEHIVYALASAQNGLIGSLLTKCGIDRDGFASELLDI